MIAPQGHRLRCTAPREDDGSTDAEVRSVDGGGEGWRTGWWWKKMDSLVERDCHLPMRDGKNVVSHATAFCELSDIVC